MRHRVREIVGQLFDSINFRCAVYAVRPRFLGRRVGKPAAVLVCRYALAGNVAAGTASGIF